VAIQMQPNDPNKMYTVDDVDWNQIPPDNQGRRHQPRRAAGARHVRRGGGRPRPRRPADRGHQAGHRQPRRHPGGDAQPGQLPGAADRAPERVVALPDGRPAAVHAGDLGVGARPRAELDARAVRHQDRDLLPDRQVADGTGRCAGVHHQRQTVRGPRRRVLGQHLPALLGRRYRPADRAAEGPRCQHPPAGGPPDAGQLLHPDGPGQAS
jgi:hypothetical protein